MLGNWVTSFGIFLVETDLQRVGVMGLQMGGEKRREQHPSPSGIDGLASTMLIYF